jgi:hypothetical protein
MKNMHEFKRVPGKGKIDYCGDVYCPGHSPRDVLKCTCGYEIFSYEMERDKWNQLIHILEAKNLGKIYGK